MSIKLDLDMPQLPESEKLETGAVNNWFSTASISRHQDKVQG